MTSTEQWKLNDRKNLNYNLESSPHHKLAIIIVLHNS